MPTVTTIEPDPSDGEIQEILADRKFRRPWKSSTMLKTEKI